MPEETSKKISKPKIKATDTSHVAGHVDPSATTPHHASRQWQPSPSIAKKQKRLTIILVAIATFFIACAGGWFTYALWYQNPDKVLIDAVMNTARAKTIEYDGALTSKTGDDSTDVDVKGVYGRDEGLRANAKMTYRSQGNEVKVEVDGVVLPTMTTGYVRVKDVDKIYDGFVGTILKAAGDDKQSEGYSALMGVLDQAVGPMVKKVNNKWVKSTVNDLKKINAYTFEQYECSQDVFKKMSSQSDQVAELGHIFQGNQFFRIDKNHGVEGDYFRFEVGIDYDKLTAFMKALKDTELYAQLQECYPAGDSPLDFDVSELKEGENLKAEVWISQLSHQFHKINFSTSAENDDNTVTQITVSATLQFNNKITVSEPNKDVITFDDAFKDIGDYLRNMIQFGQRNLPQNRT